MIAGAALLAGCAILLAWAPLRSARAHRQWSVAAAGALLRLQAHPIVGGRRRRNLERGRVRDSVAELAAQLTAGQPLRRAIQRSCAEGVAPRTLAAARWGGDVSEALQADSRMPGREVLAAVAACWSVAEGSGAGLALALNRLVQQERQAQEVRVQLQAHLAAPRATARMLSALPAFGIALGMMLGANPIAWFGSSPIGMFCLVGGLFFIALGLWWTSRISSRVEALL